MALEVQFGDTVIRSAPVVGAVGVDAVSHVMGLTMGEWFYVAAIAYTFVQAWAVIHKTLKNTKENNND